MAAKTKKTKKVKFDPVMAEKAFRIMIESGWTAVPEINHSGHIHLSWRTYVPDMDLYINQTKSYDDPFEAIVMDHDLGNP